MFFTDDELKFMRNLLCREGNGIHCKVNKANGDMRTIDDLMVKHATVYKILGKIQAEEKKVWGLTTTDRTGEGDERD